MARPFVTIALCFVGLVSLVDCSASTPPLAASAAGARAYQLNSGDKVRVTVFNDPSLSGEFSVTGDGNLSLPLIGNLPVRGETIEAAQSAIRTRLANGYVNDPRVTLEVIAFRPYFILGEVARPGEYPFADGLTIVQAAAVAGGFTYRANQREIFIKRAGDSVERKVDTKTMTAYVMPGDTIRIGERYF